MSMTRGAKMLMVRNESNRARNEGGSGGRNEMRNDGGYGMRNEMRYNMRGEGGSGGRNEMGYGEMNYDMRGEGGSGGRNDYGGMNYGESRFRDRRGREHYDNGRFAPMRGEMEDNMENRRGGSMEMGYGEMRNEMRGGYGEMRGAQNEMRGEMGYNEMRNARNEMRGDMRGNYGDMRNEMRGDMRGSQNEMRVAYGEMRGGQSHYPFGPVPPVYERGAEMNRIGFVVPFGRSEVGGNYPNDAAYSAMGEMEYRTHSPTKGGASGETMMLTEDMAHEWMQNLHNEDGTKGPHWTKEQVKQVINQKGIKEDPVEFWVALNASYSDLCGVAKKHGVNTMDYYIDYAKAFWFDDKDAKEGKLARYFQHITK